MRTLRRLAAILCATPLLIAGAATTTQADPGDIVVVADTADFTTSKRHYAEFTGRMAADKRSGRSTSCEEIVTTGPAAGTFGCIVTWKFTDSARGSICTTDENSGMVAEADYFSAKASATLGGILLSGYGQAGAAVLTGTAVTDGPNGERHVFRITIDAADACGTAALLARAGIEAERLTTAAPPTFFGTADYT